MMPIKEILAMKHLEPRPPVLVIDETTIKCTKDAGPVCGCDEKYDLIKNYKPFLPGGVNPYKKKQIPDDESFEVYWKQLKIGECGFVFEKPVVVHRNEISGQISFPKETEEDLMFVRQPMYTQDYIEEKLRQCEREHSDGCHCAGKGKEVKRQR